MSATGRRQQGGGTLLFLVLIALVVVVALGIMRILPMYLDYFAIMSSLEGTKEDPRSLNMSAIELRTAIEKRFDINSVTSISARDLRIKRERGVHVVELDYEVRRPLVGNLDVVAHFQETVEIDTQ